MSTKEKILESARFLYNKYGIDNITTRDIAKDIAISAGNLHYHFKHTEDILIQLFHAFEKEFDTLMATLQNQHHFSLDSLNQFIVDSVVLVHKYKFVPLNFQSLSQKNQKIRSAYIDINKRRKVEFLEIFLQLVQKKIFRKDIPEKQFLYLVRQIFIVGDFWIAYNEASFRKEGKEAVREHCKMLKSLFYPYLTTPQTLF
ncbi:TetR/AcrR family transcriptional regulator [Rhizosphaericola mali]|uniref:TetR/AcrR family transcriptional regulator n=1 Tax=Rhizosphaericola mali TaxID=2545455 RepID=A0A5P2G950_9BACT|nr:TetR/AcrR family transcriptional regulator [Rhizosphaericola mali]QES88051.1 TetR/AcrR family transcriptional regulator [Rhizosphaericola mali]QES88770.1 TetR/AcrR family transcriptional regulator [Rhizosphaericola mali]